MEICFHMMGSMAGSVQGMVVIAMKKIMEEAVAPIVEEAVAFCQALLTEFENRCKEVQCPTLSHIKKKRS